MLDNKVIGKRIKEFRVKKGLSQEKLAELCNLSVPYMSLIETGKRNVSLEVLIKLGNNLGVTVDTFLKGCQKNDVMTYKMDLTLLVDDCSCYERQIIYEIAAAVKKSLRDNNCLDYMSKF